MPGERKKYRKKRQTPWLKIFLISFALLIVLILAWKIVDTLSKGSWDGTSRINLVIDADNVYLASFDDEEKKLLVVSVPRQTYVEVAYGFGFYPIGAVYKLGEIEAKGGQILTLTAQEFFAAPIDGWVKVESVIEQGKLGVQDGVSVKKEILKLLQNSKTNLGIYNRIRLWWEVRKVRFDKIVFLNLDEKEILTDFTLSEGTIGKTADLAKLDSLLSPLLADGGVREESLKVEIINSTGKPGLGNRVSRLINNLGAEVVSLGNQEEKIDHCIIRIRKGDAQKKTVQKLIKIYSCQLEEKETLDSRADLVFIVGEDYRKMLSQN